MTMPAHAEPDAADKAAARAGYDVTKLYQPRVQIYPARVRGRVRAVKWIALVCMLAVYYGTPWLRWPRGSACPTRRCCSISRDGAPICSTS